MSVTILMHHKGPSINDVHAGMGGGVVNALKLRRNSTDGLHELRTKVGGGSKNLEILQTSKMDGL